jgi:hypothetical protein
VTRPQWRNNLRGEQRNDAAVRTDGQDKKKAPSPEPCITVDVLYPEDGIQTTSFSSEQPFSSQQLSWLRSSLIDSPNSNLRFKNRSVIHI